MRYLAFIVFLIAPPALAQSSVFTSPDSLANRPVLDLIDFIEKNSHYRFYYHREWIDTMVVEHRFVNKDINTVLEEVFAATPLNYYILNEKIILTYDVRISDDIHPDLFSGTNKRPDTNESIDPLARRRSSEERVRIIVIGSESDGKEKGTIAGYVREADTGEPIAGASIISERAKKGTTSDTFGFYSLMLPAGKHLVTVQFVGMEDQIIQANVYGDGNINFNLESAATLLKEVMVESDRDLLVSGMQMGMNRIDVRGMKNVPKVLGENDLLKIALAMPGVKSVGEGAAGLNVRGGGADQNLVILNEGTIYNPAHFLGFFSVFNADAIKSFEIYKSGIPAQYGGRLASIFDIQMKDGSQKKFQGQGGIGPITSNLTLEIPLVKDKTSLMVGGRSTYSNWVLRQIDNEAIRRSKPSFYDFFSRITHNLDSRNSLYFTGYYSRDNFRLSYDSLFSYHNALASIQWRHVVNPNLRWLLSATYSDYAYRIRHEAVPSDAFSLGFDIKESNVKWNLDHQVGLHQLSYGIQSKLYRLSPGFMHRLSTQSDVEEKDIEHEKGVENALYVSDQWEITQALSVELGLRYSLFTALGPRSILSYEPGVPKGPATVSDTAFYSGNERIQSYHGPEWRLSARYKLTDESSVKLSYNRTRQYLHMLSNTVAVSPTNTWKLVDPNIKPQRGDQWSVGYYRILPLRGFEVSAEGYFKLLTDVLDYKTGATVLLNERIETDVVQGEGKAYGVELLLKKKSGKLTGWFGYTYSRSFLRMDSRFASDRINNGKFFPANFDKPHDISLISNYRITRRYSIAFNFAYSSGRPITYPVGFYRMGSGYRVDYSDRNQYRIDDYIRIDLGFNIEGNHKIRKLAHSFWSLSIYNVLGRRNPYSVYFVVEDGEVNAYKLSIFGAPIPTITYNFKF